MNLSISSSALIVSFRLLHCVAFVLLTSAAGLIITFPVRAQTLSEVEAWAYQLQDIDLAEIAANDTFELIIIDYSSTGGESGEWTAAEIDAVRAGGKHLVAYISIGEAEDYRFYWNSSWETSPPSWLGPINPDWPGNYAVRFWDPDWQQIIRDYLDRIAAQNFDGIYMDIIEAYYYWSVENPEQPNADALMVDFIAMIREHLAVTLGRPEMFMIPQNGSFLIVEENVTPEKRDLYLASIDAIGVEDVFHPGDLDENNPFNPDQERLGMLAEYLAESKPVFSIDYLTDPGLIDQYTTAAFAAGFHPYASVRALDILKNGISGDSGVALPWGDSPLSSLEGRLRVWPNPARESIWLRLPEGAPEHHLLSILDLAGRTVRQTPLSVINGAIGISLSDLPNGRYFTRLDGFDLNGKRARMTGSVVVIR